MIGRRLADIAIAALTVAAALFPAFALAEGTADVATWSTASRHAAPIMAAIAFAVLALADCLARADA